MKSLLYGGTVFRNGQLERADLLLERDRIAAVDGVCGAGWDLTGLLIVPGFVDVHVHLRQPGYEEKETIASGTAAAAAGGYTTVCAMPNLNPVPDSREHLAVQQRWIRRDAQVRVLPYGAITQREQGQVLSDMVALAPDVIGFSDDGRGVQSRELMRQAMLLAKSLDRPIVAHCEDESLLPQGWAVHEGEASRRFGLPGNPSDSEWRQVERDLTLVEETGCRYHVCHVSTRESVALIRAAKRQGLHVTCETAPHYLCLCDGDLFDDGRFKMNPPIRSPQDREALIQGLLDGTIDCIATDHAPHTQAEKSGGLGHSLNGVVGLETAFPVLYTRLVRAGQMPFEILLRALCVRPREIFGLEGGSLDPGDPADLTVLDLDHPHRINAGSFRSLGRSTPFDGWEVSAAVVMTFCGGEVVYDNQSGDAL